MESMENKSQAKRTERVKSIFDSDDSDEDNSNRGFSPSHCKDDDDDELRKKIDEVCFNLSNEDDKLGLGISSTSTDIDLGIEKHESHMKEFIPHGSGFSVGELAVSKNSSVFEEKNKGNICDTFESGKENKNVTESKTNEIEFQSFSVKEYECRTNPVSKNNEINYENVTFIENKNLTDVESEKNTADKKENVTIISFEKSYGDDEKKNNEDISNDSLDIGVEEEKLKNEIDVDISVEKTKGAEIDFDTEEDKSKDEVDMDTEKDSNKEDEMDLDIEEKKSDDHVYLDIEEEKYKEDETDLNRDEETRRDKTAMDVDDDNKNQEDETDTEVESLTENEMNKHIKKERIKKDAIETLSPTSIDIEDKEEEIEIKNQTNETMSKGDLSQTDYDSMQVSESEIDGNMSPKYNGESKLISHIENEGSTKVQLKGTKAEFLNNDIVHEQMIVKDSDDFFDKVKEIKVLRPEAKEDNSDTENVDSLKIPIKISDCETSLEQVGNSASLKNDKSITDDAHCDNKSDDEKMKTEIKLTDSSYNGKHDETNLDKEDCDPLKKTSGKESDLANLTDVWNTVNIFQGPRLVSISEVGMDMPSAKEKNVPELHDNDSDSGTDVNDKEKSNFQSGEVNVVNEDVQEEMGEHELCTTVQGTKESTSSPWEAMKNGSLFEDIQMLHGQSPEYQTLEILKRKKVRVEDVFTDSEGEDGTKHFEKIKGSSSDILVEECTAKKMKKKRERATSINLPAIMLAFEKGWIREVVYRSSAGIANKRADIYYYSPTKRKLRSRVELEEYLLKNNITDLTLQNFSFFKEPLGVEERYEKIRLSSSMVKLGDAAALSSSAFPSKPLPKKRERKPTSKVKDLPPAKKVKAKEVVKKVLIKEALPKHSTAFNKKKTCNIAPKPNYPVPSADSPVYATHLYPTNPPLTQARIITPVIRGEAKDKTFHCTPSCEAGGGNVPNLQCVKCVCLFHPECCQMPPQTVSLILSAIARFLCPNCYREENTTKTSLETEFYPAPCFEPLAFDPSSESEDEGLVSDFEHPSFKKIHHRPKTPPLPPLPPLHETAKQFSALRAPNLNVPMLPLNSNNHPSTQAHSSNTLQVPQLLPNLPVAVPLPPNSSTGPNTFLLYQPIPPKNHSMSPQIYMASSANQHHQRSKTVPEATVSASDSQQGTLPAVKKLCPTKRDLSTALEYTKVTAGVRGGEHFIEDMSLAYKVMKKIFSYFSVMDLLEVSRVNVLWRDLARNPSYWRKICLWDVTVNDVDKMIDFLDQRGTTEIDLRNIAISPQMLEQKNKQQTAKAMTDVQIIVTGDQARKEDDIEQMEVVANNTHDSENKVCDRNTRREIAQKPNDDQIIAETDEVKENNDDTERIKTEEATENKESELDEPMAVENETPTEQTKKENKAQEMDHLNKEDQRNLDEELPMEVDVEEKEEEQQETCESDEKHRAKEEEERKEKEKKDKMSYILSDHDYFGRARSFSSSSSSSSSSSGSSNATGGSNSSVSSSGSSDSGDEEEENEEDAGLEVTEEDIERTFQSLEDKLSSELPLPVGEETLKPLLMDLPLGQAESVVEKPSQDGTLPQSPPRAFPALPTPSIPVAPPLPLPPSEEESQKEMDVAQNEVGKEKEEIIQDEGDKRVNENEKSKASVEQQLKKEETERQLTKEEVICKQWDVLGAALGSIKFLRTLTVGSCNAQAVETVLSHCQKLGSFNAIDLKCQTDDDSVSFDPSYLMQARGLEELRITSQRSFTFKSNFNFIKLPRLKVLMLKGLKTTDIGWPYLGTQLTHLYLSPINTFSHHNWLNVSSMTDLVELELNGSGSDHDTELCSALCKLTKLERITLLDWNIGSKLPYTLKRLHNIQYLHIIPGIESQSMKGIFAGRLMVILESSKHLTEFIWGIQEQNILFDETSGEKIFILSMKGGKETGTIEGEEVRSVSIDNLKGFIKCRIPQTKIAVRKVSSNPSTWSSEQWR